MRPSLDVACFGCALALIHVGVEARLICSLHDLFKVHGSALRVQSKCKEGQIHLALFHLG